VLLGHALLGGHITEHRIRLAIVSTHAGHSRSHLINRSRMRQQARCSIPRKFSE
jgi:hypothetical protein